MSDYIALEWNNNEMICAHIIKHGEPNDKWWYRDVTSIEAYRNRELQRKFPFDKKIGGAIPNKDVTRYFSLRPLWEWNESEAIHKKCYEATMKEYGGDTRFPSITDGKPEIHHADIWAFYKHIGYDYKRKTYVTT